MHSPGGPFCVLECLRKHSLRGAIGRCLKLRHVIELQALREVSVVRLAIKLVFNLVRFLSTFKVATSRDLLSYLFIGCVNLVKR